MQAVALELFEVVHVLLTHSNEKIFEWDCCFCSSKELGEQSVRKPKTKHPNKEDLQWTLDQANVTPIILDSSLSLDWKTSYILICKERG